MCDLLTKCPKYEARMLYGIKGRCEDCVYAIQDAKQKKKLRIALIVMGIVYLVTTYILF